MLGSPALLEAVAVYFEAKALLFQDVPDFRLLDVGPLKCFHNHPGWHAIDAFYALNAAPAEVVAAIRNYCPDANHRVTAFTAGSDSLKAAYLELGYQLLPWAQPFMVKPLLEPVDFGSSEIVQVRQTLTTRDYWIEESGQPICWGRSMMTSAKAIYVSGMETLPAYRRHGLASAILHRLHSDALASGAELSVLCSSPLGLPLYLARGYKLLARMQAFVPAT